ncbi:MAG: glycosyltransferase [Gemmatimonadales bacterium]|nr:glycosyltransferase [Gemmatimonadales bacterium]MDZ4390386.1 glycosyltransferase [Gemmatimonadales bacterium]
MQLGFVCTNYNNSAVTRSAIASLRVGNPDSRVPIVVVDNKSRDEDVQALQSIACEFPEVELVLNQTNVGYFPGLNIGIAHLRTRFPALLHMAVGNNDLIFPPDFVAVVERHKDIFDVWAVVAPDLVTPEGVHQNPHVLASIGRVRKWIWDVYFSSYGAARSVKLGARLTRRFTARKENAGDSEYYTSPGPIEQGYGACYLLGPIFFRHFRRLCAPTFMMQEEFFLAEQLRRIDQMVYYDPRFVVQHHGHATTDTLPSRRHWEISRDAHAVYKRYLAMGPEERTRFIDEASEVLR